MKQHVSISKQVVAQLREREEPVYPRNFESLYGSISDDSFTRPENIQFKKENEREQL